MINNIKCVYERSSDPENCQWENEFTFQLRSNYELSDLLRKVSKHFDHIDEKKNYSLRTPQRCETVNNSKQVVGLQIFFWTKITNIVVSSKSISLMFLFEHPPHLFSTGWIISRILFNWVFKISWILLN